MRLSSFLFYVLPLLLIPAVVAFAMYQRGGMELLLIDWPHKLMVLALLMFGAFLCWRLDCWITQPKQKRGGIRRSTGD